MMPSLEIASVTGTHTLLEPPVIKKFGSRLVGRLVLPCDNDYEPARRVWNGMVDKKPAIIARCAVATDVVEAVNFARDHGLLVSVRGGGHNIAGNALCEGGLTIDLSGLKGIRVDSEHRTARAEAGLTLGEFDAATQAIGLATTMGVNSDTGVSGLTLGGGIGRLGRKYGLACDNLIAGEVVTAEGNTLRASATENPDLLWALRGGGGNFGIVTTFEYRLHHVGPTILGGLVLYDFKRAKEALKFYYEFSSTAPNEVSADAILMTAPDGAKMLAISACYVGPIDEGERALKALRTLSKPTMDQIAPIPYIELQASADGLFPGGRRYYWKAQFLREIDDAAIETLVNGFATVPSTMSLIVLQQVGGAIARVPGDATAYVNRDAAYDCFPISVWQNPADDERNIGWVRELWSALRPFSTGGVYVNNLGEEGEDRVQAAYGSNYARLVALKTRYDPTNFFRLNQNIQPAP